MDRTTRSRDPASAVPTGGEPRASARAGVTGGASAWSAFERRAAELLAAGDLRRAATETIRAVGPGLLRYLRGLLGSEVDAEEAFSRACEQIWLGLGAFRGEASVRTWAYRLAWSAAADVRKEAWRVRGRHLRTGELEALPGDDGTRSWLRFERLRLTLADLRAALTLEEQSLLQLRLDQGLSWAECAEVLATRGHAARPDALMKRFERIKVRLRKLAEARR